jgi:hypothetical protein
MIKITIGYPDFAKPQGAFFKNISALEKTKMFFYDVLQTLFMWGVPILAGIGIQKNIILGNPSGQWFFFILGAMPLIFPIRIWAESNVKIQKIHDSLPA